MKIVRSLENRLPLVMAALAEVSLSGAYAEGKFNRKVIQQLESMLPGNATLFNSCGSSLYTVFKWLRNLGYDSALIQNNTFFATGACAAEAGMSVYLVDSSPKCPSMGIDSLIAAHKVSGSRVVVLTHVGGWLAKDYVDISEYCKDNNLVLVEDCAHALGVPGAGSLCEYSCWSFYPTKAVPSGEGGAVLSKNAKFNSFAKEYSSYGKYIVDGVMRYSKGMNLRMSEWDAAVLSVQLDALNEILALRQQDAKALQSIADCLLDGPSNYYKYPVSTDSSKGLKVVGGVYAKTDQLLVSLVSYGVFLYVPLPHSAAWAENHKCLPIGEGLYTGMSTEEVLGVLRV